MVDAAAILSAERLGYKIHIDNEDLVWYVRENKMNGPFKSYDEAAYEALAEHEINEAFKFWKGVDAGS